MKTKQKHIKKEAKNNSIRNPRKLPSLNQHEDILHSKMRTTSRHREIRKEKLPILILHSWKVKWMDDIAIMLLLEEYGKIQNLLIYRICYNDLKKKFGLCHFKNGTRTEVTTIKNLKVTSNCLQMYYFLK